MVDHHFPIETATCLGKPYIIYVHANHICIQTHSWSLWLLLFPIVYFFLRLKQLKPGSIPTLEGFFYMLKPHFPTRLVAMHTSVSLRPGRWPLPLFLGWCSPRHLGSQYIAYCRCIYIYIHTVCIYIYCMYIYIYTCHVFTWLGYACIIVCIYIYICMCVWMCMCSHGSVSDPVHLPSKKH